MHKENGRLEGELLKANKTIELLNENIQIEHEEGFNKVVRQAAYLLGADPLSAGFDIAQDVYEGKMMLVPVSDGEEDPVEEDAGEEDAGEENANHNEDVGDDDGVGDDQ